VNRHYEPLRLAPLLTINQTAGLLGISRDTLYRILCRGELVSTRVGSRHRFRMADVEEYLDRRCESAADRAAASKDTSATAHHRPPRNELLKPGQ
jgi:excisionase family DNA binding protein